MIRIDKYGDRILEDGADLYLPLDEASGPVAKALVGFDGEYLGNGLTYGVTGPDGTANAVHFNGTTGTHVRVLNTDNRLQFGPVVTDELWFRVINWSQYASLTGYAGNTWDIRMDSVDSFRSHPLTNDLSGSPTINGESEGMFNDGKWHHLVRRVLVDVDNPAISIMLDGFEIATGTIRPQMYTDNVRDMSSYIGFHIGSANGRYADVEICRVARYPHWLPNDQIWQHLELGTNPEGSVKPTRFIKLGGVLKPYEEKVSFNGNTYPKETEEFSVVEMFSSGVSGAYWNPSAVWSLFQDAEGTIPVDRIGQPVGRMLDLSGNGHHMIQETTTARPILIRDENGRLCLYKDGVDDMMYAMDTEDWRFTHDGSHFYILYQVATIGNLQNKLWGNKTAGGNSVGLDVGPRSTGTVYTRRGTGYSGASAIGPVGGLPIGHVGIIETFGFGEDFFIYLDGATNSNNSLATVDEPPAGLWRDVFPHMGETHFHAGLVLNKEVSDIERTRLTEWFSKIRTPITPEEL